jgi:hypothetical protein
MLSRSMNLRQKQADNFSLAAIGTEEALETLETEFKRWWS